MEENRIDIATSKFKSGFNCAQSVLFSYCKELKLDEDTALKLATGFGAGMGRKEEVCGAVTGGILVLGAKYGRNGSSEKSATETTYSKTRELMDSFSQKHGSFICRKLLGECELTSAAGQAEFKEKSLFDNVCIPCVQSVVKILEGMVK